MRHAAGFLAAFVVLTLPYLVWDPRHVLDAYSIQGGRTITGESFWYLPLHWFGQAQLGDDFTQAASVPGWADRRDRLQLAVVAGVLAARRAVRGAFACGVAVAALGPVAFLLTNRIFSSAVPRRAARAWAIAIALLARSGASSSGSAPRPRQPPTTRSSTRTSCRAPSGIWEAGLGAAVRRRAGAHGLVAPDCTARGPPDYASPS